MATLLLATRHTAGNSLRTLASPSLRTWLRDGWAILFSHPDDFARFDLEMDRWLVVTGRAFADRGIRPLSLASQTEDDDRSWVAQVHDDARTILLEDRTQLGLGTVDLQAAALREEIEQPGRRFVMIIDSALRKQKVFSYNDLSGLPSPLEFLGLAEKLRARQASAETNSRTVPDSRSLPIFATRRHKHPVPQVACTPAVQARASWLRMIGGSLDTANPLAKRGVLA